MALIVKTFHEYHRCANWIGGRTQCEKQAAGWLTVRTPDSVTFAHHYCEDCGRRNLEQLNAFTAEQGEDKRWEFVPAAWQVDILTRNKTAWLSNSLSAQGLDVIPAEDDGAWAIAA